MKMDSSYIVSKLALSALQSFVVYKHLLMSEA